MKHRVPSTNFKWHLAMIFALLTVSIVASALVYYSKQRRDFARQASQELRGIADLKMEQIVHWRQERLKDAYLVRDTPAISDQVQAFLAAPASPKLRAQLLNFLASFQKHGDYESVLLIDPQLEIRLAYPEHTQTTLDAVERALVERAVSQREVVLTDLYRSLWTGAKTNDIHLDVLIPLFVPPEPSPATAPKSEVGSKWAPMGMILLRVNPRHFLYPIIHTWPALSRSAETLLVRREGSGVLFLNELRHRAGTALSLWLPLNQPNLPAALAVYGTNGLTQGTDYRGRPVLAALGSIPDSPWHLVAKVDEEEVYAPMRQRELLLIVLVSALVLTAGLGTGLVWQRRENHFAQQQAEKTRQAEVVLREQTQRHNLELEQRVTERTRQLEEANQELEAFSYSVSHDLRAPLRAIDGFSRILQQDHRAELSAPAQRYLQLVREGAERMGQLIDDLLAFSRLSRQPLNTQPVEPASLVHQALAELKAEQTGRQVEITVGQLAPCQGDPSLLRQVFTNLLSNALKYTRPRAVARIEIGCRPQDQPIVYYVKDNGVGFDMQYAPKLFGVFQRLHRVEEFEGTGVGLAIVQRIIHRHGGRIWVEAEPDRGATFYFTLGSDCDVAG